MTARSFCIVDGCDRTKPHDHAMCRSHWGRVPRDLQQAVYKAWRERLRDYPGAVERHHQALENAAAAVEGREPIDHQLGELPDPNSAASYGEHPLGGAW